MIITVENLTKVYSVGETRARALDSRTGAEIIGLFQQLRRDLA